MRRFCICMICFSFGLFSWNCSGTASGEEKHAGSEVPVISASADPTAFLFDTLLCDGFDFPVGDKNAGGGYTSLEDHKHYDSWYRAVKTGDVYELGIHTGEDWNGSGGSNTDLGQPVYAAASGLILYAGECPSPWGNVVMIEHHYLENGTLKTVYSQYAHLKEIFVKKGDEVSRRQKIGSIGQGNFQEYAAHLHFEIRSASLKDFPADYWPSSNGKDVKWVKDNYLDGSAFIKEHRNLLVPAKEKKFAVVIKNLFKCYYYQNGKMIKQFEIALGQSPVGNKEKQGDLRVPEGEYRVCEKTKGPFDTTNWVNAYLGTRWIRLNYPNKYDAKRGLQNNWITQEQYSRIVKADQENKMPPKNTPMGGGIGIHGWVKEEWDNNSSRAQTWGCVSFHNKDLEEFFDDVEINTRIVILP